MYVDTLLLVGELGLQEKKKEKRGEKRKEEERKKEEGVCRRNEVRES